MRLLSISPPKLETRARKDKPAVWYCYKDGASESRSKFSAWQRTQKRCHGPPTLHWWGGDCWARQVCASQLPPPTLLGLIDNGVGSVLRRLRLFGTCIRGGQAELIDNIQREQCCYEKCYQHTDDRSQYVAAFGLFARFEPAAPTTLAAPVGLVRG